MKKPGSVTITTKDGTCIIRCDNSSSVSNIWVNGNQIVGVKKRSVDLRVFLQIFVLAAAFAAIAFIVFMVVR